jgi:hypothetical protein
MIGRFGMAAIAATGLCFLATGVQAQPSKAVQACESNAGKTLSKFTSSKSKCISKCVSTLRKTMATDYSGCFLPYADPTTNACITGSLKGAEAKAGAGIAKKCAAADACPDCWKAQSGVPDGSQRCTDASGANPFVVSTETQIDPFPLLLYCTESTLHMTPDKDHAKCEDGATKALVKFVGSKTKCYDKCNTNMNKGKALPGSCTPPATDPPTVTCISTAEGKASASIDKVCATPGFNPSCYGTALDTGAEWVNLVESQVDITTPTVACGSPSGAFLN